MATVTAHQNETLDEICYRFYGVNTMLESVIIANPDLAKFPIRLPEGTSVVMPDQVQQTSKKRLWD